MKRIALAGILVMLAVTGAAVVGHNGSEGDLQITSGSSAGASQAVNQNGTLWKAEVSMTESACSSGEADLVRDEQFKENEGEYTVSFEGTLQTSDPCHTIEHEVEKVGDRHVLEISSIDSTRENEVCVDCVGEVSYEASFHHGERFDLEVVHDGESVENLSYASEGAPVDKEGFLFSFRSFLQNLI